MIKLQIIGHLGKDATTNTVNEQNVVNFSVCHTETYMQNGEKKSKSIWVECAKWASKEQGITKYLTKGTQVYVEGNPEVKTFAKNDGTTGTSLTLRVFDLQLLGSGKKDGDSNASAAQPSQSQAKAPAAKEQGYKPVSTAADMTEPIDDLPF